MSSFPTIHLLGVVDDLVHLSRPERKKKEICFRLINQDAGRGTKDGDQQDRLGEITQFSVTGRVNRVGC